MKTHPIEAMERWLQLLPLLAVPCDDCQKHHGLAQHLAVVRNPADGRYLCSSCAWLFAKEHKAHFVDLSQALCLRRHFHAHPASCIDCKDAAQRLCTKCGSPLCYQCGYQVTRTGRTCYVCHCLEAVRAAELKSMYIEVF